MIFRYTPRFKFYATWYSCTLLLMLVLSSVHYLFLKSIGIDPSGNTQISDFWFEKPALYFGISIGVLIIILIISFIIPMKFFLKVFDKTGEITVYDDHAVLEYENKTVNINYEDMLSIGSKIHFAAVLHANKSPLYEFKIETETGKYRLACSELEMRQSKPRSKSSLQLAMDDLMKAFLKFEDAEEIMDSMSYRRPDNDDFMPIRFGQRFTTSQFDFVVNSAHYKADYNGIYPNQNEVLVVANMFARNSSRNSIRLSPEEFTLNWLYDIAEKSFCFGENIEQFQFGSYEEKEFNICFIVPADTDNSYCFSYIDSEASIMYALEFNLNP